MYIFFEKGIVMIELMELFEEDIVTYKNDLVMLLEGCHEDSFPDQAFNDEFYRYALDDLKAKKKQNLTQMYGYVDQSQLIGLICFHEAMVEKNRLLHIYYLVVNENYRGKGLGKKLLKKAEEYAKKHGIVNIQLYVSKDNKEAVGFYSNQDFGIARYLMKKKI